MAWPPLSNLSSVRTQHVGRFLQDAVLILNVLDYAIELADSSITLIDEPLLLMDEKLVDLLKFRLQKLKKRYLLLPTMPKGSYEGRSHQVNIY